MIKRVMEILDGYGFEERGFKIVQCGKHYFLLSDDGSSKTMNEKELLDYAIKFILIEMNCSIGLEIDNSSNNDTSINTDIIVDLKEYFYEITELKKLRDTI